MDTILKQNIEKFISNKKYSLSKFSEVSGVSLSTISRILSGEIKNPTSYTIEQLSKAIKIPPDKLINNEIEITESEVNNQRNIKQRLHYLLVRSKLNIDALSSLSGVSKGTIRSILVGETRKPNIETCNKIADFFGITVKQLRCEDDLQINSVDFYRDIPLVNIKNISKWVTKNDSKYVEIYKSFLISEKGKCFCIAIENADFEFEYEKGDVLIFEETNQKSLGKFISEIRENPALIQIYSFDDQVKYREIGTSSKLLISNDELKIFGKLIEVKVNNDE